MADETAINQSLKDLQIALDAYLPEYTGGQDGLFVLEQLPQGVYESTAALMRQFSRIEPVTQALNAANVTLSDAYDPAVMEALTNYLTSSEMTEQRTAFASGSNASVATYLREQGFPEIFTRDPQKLFNFIDNNLETMSAGLNALDGAGYLNAPPLPAEIRAAQSEAITGVETYLNEEYIYQKDLLDTVRQQLTERLTQDAYQSEDAQASINTNLAQVSASAAELEIMHAKLQEAQFNEFDMDDAAHEALQLYMVFLQKNVVLSRFETQDGVYSAAFASHLNAVIAGKDARLAGTTGSTQAILTEMYPHIERGVGVMDALIAAQLYDQPAGTTPITPGGPDAPVDPEILPADIARPVIMRAIAHMVRKDKAEIGRADDAGEDGAFDLTDRLLLQAFLIDVKELLDIDVAPQSGTYDNDLRVALVAKMQDPQNIALIANEYFDGRTQTADLLVKALNTYTNPEHVPLLEGQRSDVRSDVLITKPQLRGVEIDVLEVAIDRIPLDELAGLNEIVTTLSGYGLEDIMPEGRLESAQFEAMHSADRSEALAALFVKIQAEAVEALGENGGDLNAEIKERMIERLSPLVTSTAAFDSVRAAYLDKYIENAVDVALAAELSGGAPMGSVSFAAAMPEPTDFLTEHGPNSRGYRVFDIATMEGVMPSAVLGFGGAIDKAPATLDDASGAQTIDAMIADMAANFERLSSSSIAQRTMGEVQDALSENRAALEAIFEGGEKTDGKMIVTDRNGESVLLSAGENGLEIRYLDALGISGVEEIAETTFNGSFNYDEILLNSALAGYQSLNQGIEEPRHFNPEFFEMGGKHYVVGLDKETTTLQVREIDPAFISTENAAQITYATGPGARTDSFNTMMQNDTYRFLQENYAGQFPPTGSPDRIFQTMAQQLANSGNEEAQSALNLFGQRQGYATDSVIELGALPLEENEANLAAAYMTNKSRPEDVQTSSFIYLREAEDGSGKIYVVTPAVTTIETEVNGAMVQQLVTDNTAPEMYDISDPEVFKRLRDDLIRWDENGLSLRLQVVPPELMREDAFSEFYNWIMEGGKPAAKIFDGAQNRTIPEPTAEGMASLEESASGFDIRGTHITFGAAITDTGTLYNVLGYDPAAVFAAQSPAADYIVHGLEPGVWNGAPGNHEFLNENILVTFEKDGAVQTIAIPKDDFAYNPMRIREMLELDHDDKTPASVMMVDRDRAESDEHGLIIPSKDLWGGILSNLAAYEPRDPEEHERAIDPAWWRRDSESYQEALEEMKAIEDDHARLGTQDKRDMFADNCDDITCAPAAELVAGGGGLTPDRAPLAAPRA